MVRVLLKDKAQATEPEVRCECFKCLFTCHLQPLQVLHAAALGGVASVVQLLLEAGADPAAQNGAGVTGLLLAVLMGQWECAEALVLSPGGAAALQVLFPPSLSRVQASLSLSSMCICIEYPPNAPMAVACAPSSTPYPHPPTPAVPIV
jgi:ankyrin repeat protein